MQIDWLSFTPIPSLLGGALLGIAAALYVLLHGRILGISGIISGLLHPKPNDVVWRLALVLGLLTSPLWAALFFGIRPVVEIHTGWYAIMIAGFLVGFGVQYGSGCTSGHGICGLSSLSLPSLGAVMIFMVMAIGTAHLVTYFLGS